MAGHLVLLLTSDTQRRAAWRTATRSAGHHALSAHTLERAIFLLSKVRPTLVVTDAELTDGRVLALLRHVRAVEPLSAVLIVVLGETTPEEQEHIVADNRSHVRPVDAPIGPVLDEFLAAA